MATKERWTLVFPLQNVKITRSFKLGSVIFYPAAERLQKWLDHEKAILSKALPDYSEEQHKKAADATFDLVSEARASTVAEVAVSCVEGLVKVRAQQLLREVLTILQFALVQIRWDIRYRLGDVIGVIGTIPSGKYVQLGYRGHRYSHQFSWTGHFAETELSEAWITKYIEDKDLQRLARSRAITRGKIRWKIFSALD